MSTLPKKLEKTFKKLLSKVPSLTPTIEQIVEGVLRIYHMNQHMIVSKGEFYQQFALWEGSDKIVCEIVGPTYLEDLQYTEWQIGKFQELGYVIDEMFGNYQKTIPITQDEDLLEIIQLYRKIAYEIMAFSKITEFEIEFGE